MRSRVGMQDRVSRLCIVALILMPCVGRLARAQDRMLVSSSRLVFGTDTEFSASVRAGDLDGDGDLDLVIANGRHWPQQNYLLMNGGRARFSIVRPLGLDQCTSYAAEPIDVDGDGDLDIVTGNAMAPCQLFINDGNETFKFSSCTRWIKVSLNKANISFDDWTDIFNPMSLRIFMLFDTKTIKTWLILKLTYSPNLKCSM